jgi:hypothetical protein
MARRRKVGGEQEGRCGKGEEKDVMREKREMW